MAERLGDPLRTAGWLVPLLALVSAFGVWLKTWGDHLSTERFIRFWCVVFALQVTIIVVFGLFGPRKDRFVAFGVVGGLLALVVWFFAIPVLTAIGVVPAPVMLTPDPQ